MIRMTMHPIIPSKYIPMPIKAPIAADTQIVAAVVKPCISSPFLNIIPAPRKPIPETIWATIRELSPNICGDIKQNNVEPRQINDIVLIPTSFPLRSLSYPMANPITVDNIILSIDSIVLKIKGPLYSSPLILIVFRFPQSSLKLDALLLERLQEDGFYTRQ